jgi:hypothetical protein
MIHVYPPDYRSKTGSGVMLFARERSWNWGVLTIKALDQYWPFTDTKMTPFVLSSLRSGRIEGQDAP